MDPLQNSAFRAPGFWEKLRARLSGRQRPLACVQVEVTSCCPGRCIYCPHTTKAQVWRSRHMSDDVFAALWPVLRHADRVHLQGWGEPLLHPRFFDFAALARKAGCRVSTTSCGLAMNADLAGRIVESGMDIVAFSLAGTDAVSNAARRGVPFERVGEAVQLLREAREQRGGAGPELHLAYLLLADRVESVRALPELMAGWGVSVAVVSTLDYLADPAHAGLAFAPEERDKIEAARVALKKTAATAARRGRRIHYALPAPRPLAADGGCRENIGHTLYVDADGALSPCIYVNIPTTEELPERRVLGHALHGNPLEQWQGTRFADFRAALEHGVPESPCVRCAKRFEEIL